MHIIFRMSSRPADTAIGMMDGAYFTSRTDILDFFNNLLSMNLTKIEQTASGAVACQLVDFIFPGSVPMKRVNWEAKSDFQFIENYKILQAAFSKNRVQKIIDVDRLIRAKYQDNLEFCQWLKAFYEHIGPAARTDYDPVAKRSLGKGGKNLDEMFLPKGKKAKGGVSRTSRNVGEGANAARKRSTAKLSSMSTRDGHSVGSKAKMSRSTLENKGDGSTVPEDDLVKKNADLKRRNAELELTLSSVEHERDFYFDKLRGIEVMLQVHEEKGVESRTSRNVGEVANDPEKLIGKFFKVLYAKLEDNVVVTDDGEILDNNTQENMAPETDEMLNDSNHSNDSNDSNDNLTMGE